MRSMAIGSASTGRSRTSRSTGSAGETFSRVARGAPAGGTPNAAAPPSASSWVILRGLVKVPLPC